MKTRWISTDDAYRQIVAAPEMAAKEQIFRERFGPLFAAMQESAPHIPAQKDALEAAREWGMLLPEDLIDLPEALRRLEAADAWQVAEKALAEGAARFAPYTDRITVNSVTGWLLLTDPAKAEPSNKGYTGFQFPGHVVSIFDTPNDYNVPRLPGLVVHELHHLVRLGLFPWTFQQPYNVADYIVLEGMAESFAAQLYGEQVVGYYVTDIDAANLAIAKDVVQQGLDTKGDVRGYIFGDHFAERWGFGKIGMPPFGGYAVGYHVVQAYLRRTGQTVEEATFIPADEIVAESGYFD
ncbi:MAG TPA: DUF2268 domain-containing putative Zn-dependent protease [Spirillospora sp.]|nr:DUF2268 domain-containing putative Zn-dependent protease [Spirillospora sp.]